MREREIGKMRPPRAPGMKRRVRFREPSGEMHWKPGDYNEDGARCGAKGVPFTGNEALVECKKCRGHIARRNRKR